MAPELFTGAKYADARADVYAVATTLYEMLSGKLPFGATTYEELIVQVATQSPMPLLALLPQVPPAIAAAVDRGLVRDRDARWQSVQQFKDALQGALVGIVPAASHAFLPTLAASSMRTAPPPPMARHEGQGGAVWWAIGIVLMVSLVGGAFAFAMWHTLRTQPAATTTSLAASPPEESSAVVSLSPTSSVRAPVEPSTQPGATGAPIVAVTGMARPASTGGVRFKFPAKIVGQTRASAVDTLAQHIIPQLQRCRPEHGQPPTIARVQLFVQVDGPISIAQPASEPGDEDAANCIAAIFKEAATPKSWSPGGGGIVTLETTLDPR